MISKRNLLNLVLLGIVIALVSVVVLEPGKAPKSEKILLTALKKDAVSKIHIKRVGKQDIQFEKIKNVWQMILPYQLPANDFRIDAILRLVETESHSLHDLTKLNKRDFKLDKPEIVITFNDKVSIIFGGNEPLDYRRYLQIENTLHLVSDTVYYHVSGKPTALVNLQLLPKNVAIKAIQLPNRKLELKEGRWQIENEPKDMASDAVTQLLNEWKLIQALDVVAATDKPGKEQIKIFVESQDKPIVFSIVKRKPDFILLREDKGVQYQLTEDSAERLLQLATSEQVAEDKIDAAPVISK